MQERKTVFALYYGNRGFFPASLIAEAREELPRVLRGMGHECIALDAAATRHGAVETPEQGRRYAAFLAAHAGEYDGVILCLPNFGDETGAVAALQDAGVPILVQAYPDALDRMGPKVRRDSFCGKFSIMDVFAQCGIPFTALKPHVAAPSGPQFRAQVDHFARLCRVVRGMRRMTVGAIGARTTAFKTVRIDETALQRRGITVETLDLSDIIHRVKSVATAEPVFKEKAAALRACTSWTGVPDAAFQTITRLGVVLDAVIREYGMHAVALRCWVELQTQLGISPCVLLGELNERGIAASCEVDVGNAVAMHALSLGAGGPATCLDWNNNYGDDADKCIIFHCGPVPAGMMEPGGVVTDHAILANAVGKGCSWGCNVGRIRPGDMTFGSLMTEKGASQLYLGQGRFTADPVPADFFGCPGVAHVDGLQDVLLWIGKAGHRHHVSVTSGHVMAPVREALEHYLGYEVSVPQELRRTAGG